MSGTPVVTLLSKTEGRDKLLKAAAGLAKVLATFTNASQHTKLATSLSEARSIMRLGGWVVNIQKLATLPSRTLAERLFIIRVAFDMFYCVHDNLQYLTKYGVISPMQLQVLIHRSFIGLFWGFFTAVLIDIHALLTQSLTATEWRKRVLMLTRNFCDMLAGLNNVGYAKSLFTLSPRTMGMLGFVSAAISCRDNYIAAKK